MNTLLYRALARLVHASSEYLVKEDKPDVYTVSKWDGGKQPASVYTVHVNSRDFLECNCPARKACKHCKLVAQWIREGKKEGQVIEAEVAGIPASALVKAITPLCKKVIKEGFKSPEFHAQKGNQILPDNYDSMYGIEWDGNYADWDAKNLTSLVFKGDNLTLSFNDSDGEIKGEILLDTDSMKATVEYYK